MTLRRTVRVGAGRAHRTHRSAKNRKGYGKDRLPGMDRRRRLEDLRNSEEP